MLAAASGTRTAGRKLAGIEHALRLIDDAAPFNVVLALRIEGELNAATVRTALDQLQYRHPLLQARILTAKNRYFFHFDSPRPIALEVSEPSPADGWIGAAQDELHRRFDLATGPLVRCRYLPNQSGADLILTLHHTIVDAPSAGHLVSELLSLCAHQALDDGSAAAQEGRLATSALYPSKYAGVGFARAAAAFMARQGTDELKFRWRSRDVRKPPIAASGRCRILPVCFNAALTAALIRASHEHRLTLNAILSAGLLAAVQRLLYPSARAPLRHIVFTDLRPHLKSAVAANQLGCHISMLRLTVMVEREGNFWSLARDIQESTLRAARSGERFLSCSMSPAMMRMMLRLKAFRMAATALSYTGPLTLPASYGPYALAGLHAFTTNVTVGPEYSALVRLFRGELCWDILYLDSDMDAGSAEQIAREIETILEGAAC